MTTDVDREIMKDPETFKAVFEANGCAFGTLAGDRDRLGFGKGEMPDEVKAQFQDDSEAVYEYFLAVANLIRGDLKSLTVPELVSISMLATLNVLPLDQFIARYNAVKSALNKAAA